jgi:hypothetical protein
MIKAVFENDCPDCEVGIKSGDEIVFREGAWVHVECPEEKTREVCQVCFQEKSVTGACGCEGSGQVVQDSTQPVTEGGGEVPPGQGSPTSPPPEVPDGQQ